MKKHLLYIAVATAVLKLVFHRTDTLYLLAGVSFAYLVGMAPWAVYSFVANKFKRSEPTLEDLLKFSQTPEFEKRTTLANEIFHYFPRLPNDQDLKKTEVRDLLVTIEPSTTTMDRYSVTVKNVGKSTRTGLSIELKQILGWAGSFGLDTTHMPSDVQHKGDSDVKLNSIAPNEVIRTEVLGYSTPEQYRHDRIRYAKVVSASRKEAGLTNWCEVRVKLPSNANA